MDGKVQPITSILKLGTVELVIPVYQRNYDWQEKHCKRLVDDLVDVVTYKRENHFFGSIVRRAETMGFTNDFTFREIVGFEFQDEYYYVPSWREMTRILMQKLYKEHREEIRRFAGNYSTKFVHEDPDSPLYDKIGGDIWMNQHASNLDRITTLRKLFQYIGLDCDDLVFTLKD